jgi:hypothetical protein
MTYRKLNNLFGWIAFGIAAIVYLMTMEQTVSFWDCGEFLSTAYKQEVGHSPGAPFFAMMQRMFALFAQNGISAGPSKNAALLMNAESALASAGTILFLFWTITYFARKLLIAARNEEPAGNTRALILGAGMVGALAYTFSDTFWFSAVEAEVYATSSFFTALTFWAILKWERVADEPHADRWIVFIAYLVGLSVAVHLLNLLSIPAIGMVYYYRRYKATTMGALIAFVVSCVILGVVQVGILQGLPSIAGWFELTFVNSFGLPFDSGALTFLVLLVAGLIYLVFLTKKKGWYNGHLATLSAIFIIIGFSSYLIPVIRSRADVPIDMTNPDNTFSLLSYLKREQFGSQPLLYGPDFDAQVIKMESEGNQYAQTQLGGKDHYEVVGTKPKYEFEADKQRPFPRMWSSNDPNHVRFYQQYVGLAEGESPTGGDNISYFMGYQMNWMWFRYFMWNYAGRQNDFEGQGEAKNGNWISGIKPLDKMRGMGDMDKMGDGYSNNRARNQLYFLPLILGIMGMVYQFNRDRKDGWIVATMFFFTGIAIGIYLNMTPLQPRERDYAFAGSTYTFAIWIGLGVIMVHHYLQRVLKGASGVYATLGLTLLAVPVLMASQEWDDHDRSNKTLARATAINTLESCAPNAVLFTFGDNETYPLWYLQEIEGRRRDVRVINTSLLGIDWYIDQLNYKVNDADAVPMAWKKKDYLGEAHNYIMYYDNPSIPKDRYFPLSEIVRFYTSDNASEKLPTNGGQMANYLPSRNMELAAPTASQLQNFGISADSTALQPMRFTIGKDMLVKDDLAQLAILAAVAAEGWKRPVYYSSLQELGTYGDLVNYMRLEGTVYRVTPYRGAQPGAETLGEGGYTDLEKSLNLFLNVYTYGNAERNDVYFDEKNRLMFASYRINSARLAEDLTAAGRKPEAVKVLDKVVKGISERSYLYDQTMFYIVQAYYRAGAPEKGRPIALKLARNFEDDAKWIFSLGEDQRAMMMSEIQRDLGLISALVQATQQLGDAATSKTMNDKLQALMAQAQQLMPQSMMQGR